MSRFVFDRCMLFQIGFVIFLVVCLFGESSAIRCYKCKGDDECDFKTRQIYIDNCTWATKCWGARIGDHYIRSCADDRCDLQIGVGGYVESKCCYTDMCNNEHFFFPNRSTSLTRTAFTLGTVLAGLLFVQYLIRKMLHLP